MFSDGSFPVVLPSSTWQHAFQASHPLQVSRLERVAVVDSGCARIWDPLNARFESCALQYILNIPAGVSILVLLSLLLRILLPVSLPLWARNIIREEPKVVGDETILLLSQRIRWLAFEVALSFLAVLGLLSTLAAIVPKTSWLLTIPHAISWGVTLLYIAITRPKTVPGTLMFVNALMLSADLILLLNGDSYTKLETTAWAVSAAAAGLSLLTCLFMPLRHPALPTDEISRPFSAPTSGLRSPEDNLSLWQWMTVSWMQPVLKIGNARQLQDEDVWSLGYEFEHSRLHEAFRVIKGSVFRRLMLANGLDMIITSSLGILEMLAQFAGPVLLQQLLRVMQNPDSPQRAPLVFAVLTLAANLFSTQLGVFRLWYCRRVYERSRGQMITMLYEKTLRRKIIGETVSVGDDKNQNSASTGKVLNIMRGDAYEIAQRFWDWPDFITKPLGLIVSVVLVTLLIGWPCLLGVAVFIFFQLLNILITKILLYYEKQRRAATDDKLKVVSQFIEAIRHLRYNSWEGKWLEGILAARQKELNIRLRSGLFTVLLAASNSLASGLFPVFAFLALTLLAKQPLTVDIAFPALQLFSMLEDNLEEIPNLITTLINSWVAMGRIETFMKEPDREFLGGDSDLASSPADISVENVSFAWPGHEEPVLKDVSLNIPPGTTIVHGKVGSGKSALLQALLGELDILSGDYSPPNTMIAYCGQTPWLQNMSIRDNILFGRPFDRERYTQVLSACALTTDLASFINGDLSFVGENGIGLSGGQKARVALARAVYSNAPFLFLDDPISALDQQTAEHIMRQCIAGPLCKGRSIILVTHRLDLVKGLAAKIITVNEGEALIQDADLIELEDEDPQKTDANGGADANGNGVNSAKDTNDDADAVKDKFIEEEKRAHGGVKVKVYWEYIKAGRIYLWVLLAVLMGISRFVSIAETWFLKAWGESYERTDALDITDPIKRLPSPDVDIRPWLVGFSVLSVLQSLSWAFFRMNLTFITFAAGKSIFRDIMYCVSNAAFRFYDVTPIGRLMNRMTSDINAMDGPIGRLLFHFGFCILSWVVSIVVIASVTPAFFAFATVTTVMFVWTFSKFLPTSQNLRRLEMVSLSPLMANFGTLIEGLVTVRAFKAQRRFQEGVIRVVDTFQKMDHFYWSLQAWLSLRFDALSDIVTFALSLLAIFTDVSPGLTAFVLTYAANFVRSTNGMCRVYGQLELDFTSVERVIELKHIEQEPAGESPPASWPTSGEVTFEKVNIRYAPHLDLVLKDVDLSIPSGSNVAVIGRTGSGKSTMALSLLAAVRPESGTIKLDGLDICSLKPSELRRRVTFLAQEPTLFVGTMRMNLDPIEEFSEDECASVLARLGGGRYGWTLETHVDGGGKNLSQGQRQLVQLARAILRRSPLVVLDEATASIDLGTSLEVQDILRQEMAKSTVITIAHRVEAVSNANWCIELSHGRVVTQGPSSMVQQQLDQGGQDAAPSGEETQPASSESSQTGDDDGGDSASQPTFSLFG